MDIQVKRSVLVLELGGIEFWKYSREVDEMMIEEGS